MDGKPLTPEQLIVMKKCLKTDVLFDIVNDLILKNYSNGVSKVYQVDIVENLLAKGKEFSNDMLYFEKDYENVGWRVNYIESSPAYFLFIKN